MKYRAEIDGLRAVAVIPVILFHAGVGLFGGGFVGVDIFFVISGYLITSILIAELAEDRFSILKFYERRARRILPALFLVILCCLPAAWLWMLPAEFKDFSQSVAAIALFSSNFLFWQESGYFDAAAELKPLLHTWSLAVEEQYYVIFPPLLFVLWRFGARAALWVICGLGLASLIWAEIALRSAAVSDATAFYLLPSRAWELLAGSVCAFICAKAMPRPNPFAAGAGLLMILLAVFFYDGRTPFPGLWALLPVLGTVAIILWCDATGPVGRLLSNPIAVGIGLVSYSAYLWHQPLFAFARLRSIEEPGLSLFLTLSVVSFGLAALTYRFVEQPFRRRKEGRQLGSRGQILTASALSCVVLIGIGAIGHLGKVSSRLDVPKTPFNWGVEARGQICHLQIMQENKRDPICFDTAGAATLLWGDSHAASLFPGLRTVIPEGHGVTQMTQADCPPLLSLPERELQKPCPEINAQVLEQIRTDQFQNIILHARWASGPNTIPPLTVRNELQATLASIKLAAPEANVYVIGPVPIWNGAAPGVYTKIAARTEIPDGQPLYARAKIFPEYEGYLRTVTTEAGYSYVNATDILCHDADLLRSSAECVLSFSGGIETISAVDYGHLSSLAAARLIEGFDYQVAR